MDNVVSSEVHCDGLFLDALETGIFQDDQDDPSGGEEHSVTTTFSATNIKDSADLQFTLSHFRSTSVDLVGLQVWRGALLLADYLLTNSLFVRGKSVLELAAGTGITSLTASAARAAKVLCTDVDRGNILDTIRANFRQNEHIVGETELTVSPLDFFAEDWKTRLSADITWIDYMLVADVCYSTEITDAFFSCLKFCMKLSKNPRLQIVIAIEERKRVGPAGELISPIFSHFVSLLGQLQSEFKGSWRVRKLSTDFDQHFKCYERVKELNLWSISRSLCLDT